VSSLDITCIVFACISFATLLGLFVKRWLPEHHMNADSREIVKLGMGFIATLTALVLGLLVASAKGTYDTQNSSVKELSAKVILLDRALALYGPDAKEAREALRRSIAAILERIWPQDGTRSDLTPGEARVAFESLYDKIAALSPAQNDAKRTALKARAMDLSADVAQSRLKLFAQQENTLPLPLLAVLTAWLAILFAGYGLLSPRNGTVVAVLFVCALSIAGAIFLVMELTTPFTGVVRIPSTSLQAAFAQIGQ
jgi:hypothetical protein